MKTSERTEESKLRFVDETIKKGAFYRKIQVWPLADDFNFEGWLNNFTDLNERYVAAKMLSGFLYYPKNIVNRMLYDAIGNAVSAISKKTGVNGAEIYKKQFIYSYIPGEVPNPTDSGPYFMRKLRDELNIPQNNIKMFGDIVDLLQEKGTKSKLTIVFTDDLVGSGSQCVTALTETILDKFKISLYDFAIKYGHVLAYAPLFANQKGVDYIRSKVRELLFTPVHTLGEEYNLFNAKCLCWDGDEDLYVEGVELIRATSEKLGICDEINSTVSIEGYGRQGLFLGFEHGIPDSDPAIFFYNQKGWAPLMRRTYERD